ncbi:uncharacterized protein LOC126803417 [Argentina anserina]|uniref:uncharacterized protein LOC126803417 n=1 Tax=Argentina anserina TaxID=57926 RepID=UPI00217651A0|nr:uncharacterized protein LOC126803417 [Potentilla anserina]
MATLLAWGKVRDHDRKHSNKLLQTQKKLSSKQARWQDLLAEFDYTIEYKLGKANVVADALSRKVKFTSISQATSPLLIKIKERLKVDHQVQSLITLVTEGKTWRFWLDDELLYTKGRRIYIPKWGSLWKELIKECHNSKWSGHLGKSPATFKFTKSWHEQIELARAALHKVAKKIKKWAYKKRRHVEFKEGDLVFVKLLPQQFKAFRKMHKGLIRMYEGLFEVIKRVGQVSYKLNPLPPS